MGSRLSSGDLPIVRRGYTQKPRCYATAAWGRAAATGQKAGAIIAYGGWGVQMAGGVGAAALRLAEAIGGGFRLAPEDGINQE